MSVRQRKALAMGLVNFKNLKKDYKDPDLRSYGKKIPKINKMVMKVSLKMKKKKNRSY